jgi:uncharacterized protein YukE
MSDGFEYDPEAMRAFAAVFNQAGTQMGEVQATVGQTSAKAGDFGRAWEEHGSKFESYMAAISADLGKLATHLGELGGALTQGADLVVQADSTGLRNIKAIGDTDLRGAE